MKDLIRFIFPVLLLTAISISYWFVYFELDEDHSIYQDSKQKAEQKIKTTDKKDSMVLQKPKNMSPKKQDIRPIIVQDIKPEMRTKEPIKDDIQQSQQKDFILKDLQEGKEFTKNKTSIVDKNAIKYKKIVGDKYDKHLIYFLALGTKIEVTFLLDKATNKKFKLKKLQQDIGKKIAVFDKKWHPWNADSYLSKINNAITIGKPIAVDKETQNLVNRSIEIFILSSGYFDPGIGKIIKDAGFHDLQRQNLISYKPKLLIKNRNRSVHTINEVYIKEGKLFALNRKLQLDFSGNVKGLLLDSLGSYLKKQKISNYIINVGGDLITSGSNLEKQKLWAVAIDNPISKIKGNQKQNSLKIYSKTNLAIATSGTYLRNKKTSNGKVYSHIFNPKTGNNLVKHVVQATVISKDALFSDSAATALVAADNDWRKVVEGLRLTKYRIVFANGKVISSLEFKKLLSL